MIRHVIFDMDGTLADTAKASIVALAEVSARYGLPRLQDDAVRDAIGYANPEFYYRLYPEHDRTLITAYGLEVEQQEEGHVRKLAGNILFPGVQEMLEALRRMGTRLYVASTGDEAHVEVVLASAGIKSHFDVIACGRPEKVAMVGGIVGDADRAQWAMVGDRQKDLDAARGNGLFAVAAGFGYSPPEDWPNYDAVAHTPAELLEIVKSSGRQGFQ